MRADAFGTHTFFFFLFTLQYCCINQCPLVITNLSLLEKKLSCEHFLSLEVRFIYLFAQCCPASKRSGFQYVCLVEPHSLFLSNPFSISLLFLSTSLRACIDFTSMTFSLIAINIGYWPQTPINALKCFCLCVHSSGISSVKYILCVLYTCRTHFYN